MWAASPSQKKVQKVRLDRGLSQLHPPDDHHCLSFFTFFLSIGAKCWHSIFLILVCLQHLNFIWLDLQNIDLYFRHYIVCCFALLHFDLLVYIQASATNCSPDWILNVTLSAALTMSTALMEINSPNKSIDFLGSKCFNGYSLMLASEWRQTSNSYMQIICFAWE
jgi:hypothetical protein